MRAGQGAGRAALAAVALVALLGGCDTLAEVDVGPPRFELTADMTAGAVGDTFVIGFEAEGSLLLGVDVDYGDGSTERFPLTGSLRASGSAEHVYREPGSYRVTGVLRDGASERVDELTIEVTPAGS